MLSPGRVAHLLVALAIVIAYYCTTARLPDLIKDSATTFGTIAAFVTIYGVAFTIVELFRTKAVAEVASGAAQDASRRIDALYGVRSSAECQTLIESALDRLNEDGTISAGSLGRIVKLYAAEFSERYEEDASPHRIRVATVTSYAFTRRRSAFTRLDDADNLKQALVAMMADLASATARRVHQEGQL